MILNVIIIAALLIALVVVKLKKRQDPLQAPRQDSLQEPLFSNIHIRIRGWKYIVLVGTAIIYWVLAWAYVVSESGGMFGGIRAFGSLIIVVVLFPIFMGIMGLLLRMNIIKIIAVTIGIMFALWTSLYTVAFSVMFIRSLFS